MAFFGFEPIDLEEEKRKFLQEGGGGDGGKATEDIPVYTWGEEAYDGLGNQLQEGGDELNDETFGGTDEVGKDFDFSHAALPTQGLPPLPEVKREVQQAKVQPLEPPSLQAAQQSAPPRASHFLESVWDDKSPFSVLPRSNGASRPSDQILSHSRSQPPQPSKFSPFGPAVNEGMLSHQTLGSIGTNLHKGVHTLEEIEADMRAAAAAAQHQQQQQPIAQSHLLTENLVRSQIPRQGTPQHVATPPPRMHPHSQSPRFHQQQQQHQIQMIQLQQQQQQQRQLLELQEQRERQQQQQLLQLQEQLRLEEIDRQRAIRLQQMQSANRAQQLMHQRHTSGGGLSPALSDRQQRLGRSSPAQALLHNQTSLEVPFQQSLPYLPQDVQLQQRLLAEMAQQEFINNMQGGPRSEREAREEREMQELLRAEAMRKIMEAEKMEEKRRKKQAKIQYMSRYNDLMTQSDKDFITRIQVSQLVTQDPYSEDYYAQVYGALLRSRLGVQTQDDRVLKFGSIGGVGLGLGQQKGQGRRQSAMQRMEAQVERIVNNARLREKERISLNSLQGALGKTSGRSYKAAPRQLLQVESTLPTTSPAHAHISKADAASRQIGADAAKQAAKIGREVLGGHTDLTQIVRKDPLTYRESLIIIEHVYDILMELEQISREQPPPEEEERLKAWTADYNAHVQELFEGLKLPVTLETSTPHPFISVITPIKGKRLLSRVARYFNSQQMLQVLILLVACFWQLDVVLKASVLDTLEESEERAEVDAQTQAFLVNVIQSILPTVARTDLHLVSGLFELLISGNTAVAVTRTKPGLALLTLFLSRVEVIKQNMATATDLAELPSLEETEYWEELFNQFFNALASHFLALFPSYRISAISGVSLASIPNTDILDQPTWQFLASMALHCSPEQHHILVTILRDTILENVATATKGWVADEEERRTRLANVNIFLRALGLDISQITI
ncbi:uncharacterized protein LAESUDRAFT_722251 [Laetiporus sulphureus 93-53]|uniref:mRNA decay factor PAT1 domain-containing protein n=1 Tax=Laetiporus sulphureus 93-53 TaxID=1314785 RepID=A0A165GB25_9APHY|nr:uncharacterized protein LAESUDRAFT_722251 [Laetiporus sulphureus 93-53]KZT10098.1 hypothetical protein LAESUDRAFT_722251 [Laetiporus sulphureus 93-53]